jgi:sodium/bile acid cotransporter 7
MIASCRATEKGAQLALLTVVASNVIGCFTAPLMLKWQLSTLASGVAIDVLQLLLQLMAIVLIPLIVGKIAREMIPGASAFAARRKVLLGVFTNANLLCVVWLSLSCSQRALMAQPPSNILICILCGLGLHFVFWAINSVVFAVPGIAEPHHRRAVFILASQKTLPLTLALIAGLPQDMRPDLLALPCILGFVCQLTADSFLVRYLSQHAAGQDSTEAVAETCKTADAKEASLASPPVVTVAITDREMAATLPVLLQEQVQTCEEKVAKPQLCAI